MSLRWDGVLLVLTPVVAMAAVGLGLRIGAGDSVRAAVITGAPPSAAGTGLAWQLVVFDEERGVRAPVTLPSVDVVATANGQTVRWNGATNEDGAAELSLPLPARPDNGTGDMHIEVTAAGHVLASGAVTLPAALPHDGPDAPATAWARFARREGDVVLDVAVLGQRAASGFPTSLWVHATDGKTKAPLPDVTLDVERDPSLTPAESSVTTDALGWAHLTATPLGYSVPLLLHARAKDGRTGEWAGGLFVSPGATEVVAKDVYAPGESPSFDVVVPTVRTTAYVEIDDARGRAWAVAQPLHPSATEAPRVTVVAPKLAPGLYWTVAAGDASGASKLGPGTLTRPFFVAASPQAALAFGTDPTTCLPPADPRLISRVVSACLAIVAPTPVPRWMALDGFAYQRDRDARQRSRGMAIALGAILLAIVLEAVLLLRAVATSRARLRAAEASEDGGDANLAGGAARAWGVVVGVLLAMLGFALLGAFLARLG